MSNLNEIKTTIDFFYDLLLRVLNEYDKTAAEDFVKIHKLVLNYSARKDLVQNKTNESGDDCVSFKETAAFIETLSSDRIETLSKALTTFFHLANLTEENHRVSQILKRESSGEIQDQDKVNELTTAFKKLKDEKGELEAFSQLQELTFHPVFTAHPTEAKRKAQTGKIRRITQLLSDRPNLGGTALVQNEQEMLFEIDALFRTSPIEVKKPTPVQEADTIITVFRDTLVYTIPEVYNRINSWILGENAGKSEPVVKPFIKLGTWIGGDRDGNPNVHPDTTRQTIDKIARETSEVLSAETAIVARNMTLDIEVTPIDTNLTQLWQDFKMIHPDIISDLSELYKTEPYKAAMLFIAEKIKIAYTLGGKDTSIDEVLDNLKTVQKSLANAGAKRIAYGALQTLIWKIETFRLAFAEVEVRQHSELHRNALAEIEAAGAGSKPVTYSEKTENILETIRTIKHIQLRYEKSSTHRYIISFCQSTEDIENVFKLANYACPNNPPKLDVIPLFETLNDLVNAEQIMEKTIQSPAYKARLEENNNTLEIMLGYSDSSKDVGPMQAMFILNDTQDKLAKFAKRHNLKLVLFHGRGGAIGRGGGPANRAVLSQPPGSVNNYLKITEQGEVIFARYGNPVIARRHIESVCASTLLNSSNEIEQINANSMLKYKDLATDLGSASEAKFKQLVETDGFPSWFAEVTPLEEVGLLPIGSRPAKRGLSVNSLDDLRAIPWVFAWSEARINLAAWYGVGTALQSVFCGTNPDLSACSIDAINRAKEVYKTWPLFQTFIDNIEMSIAKTDKVIAAEYLKLGDRSDLASLVLDELALTEHWVLLIKDATFPLERHPILGEAIKTRQPYIDALSLLQLNELKKLRNNTDENPTLSPEEFAHARHNILCTVTGIAAGLQNTG
jgi:phosphoenolpyruvate carboxylase